MFRSRFNLKNLLVCLNLSVFGLFLFDYLLVNNLYAVSYVQNSFSGNLPRNLEVNKFTINFKLSFTESVTESTVKENLQIQLPDHEHNTENIPNESEKKDALDFVKEITSIQIDQDNNTYYATISIEIRGTKNGSLQNLVGDKDTLRVKMIYNDKGTSVTDDKTITYSSPINAAPKLTAIKSGFRSIKLEWEVPTQGSSHLREKESSSIPTNMDIILIKIPKDNPSTVYPFPTKQYKEPTDIDVAACNIKLTGIEEQEKNTVISDPTRCYDGQTCFSVSEEASKAYYYLNPSDPNLDQNLIKIVRNVFVSKGSTTLGGLEPNTDYLVLAQYQPDGVQRSGCGIATPYTNYSFSEFYEGTTSKEDDLSCFIATAAYGSPFTKELKILRWFRDTYLKSNTVGKKLVNLYYKYSPSIAKKIQDSPVLAKITRTLLYIPVSICYLLFALNPTSVSFIGFVLVILMFVTTLFMIKKLYRKD